MLLDLDLGFEVIRRQSFRLIGIKPAVRRHLVISRIEDELEPAQALLVKSERRKGGRYIGDITYKHGDQWYNLSKHLVDNNFMKVVEDAG